jgi:hypothetical protein
VKLTIEPTAEFFMLEADQPVKVRRWHGTGADGGTVQVFVACLVAPSGDRINDQLAAALRELDPAETGTVAVLPIFVAEAAAQEGAPGFLPPSDPAGAEALHVIAALEPSLRWLAARASEGAVLDALATLYLRWSVRHCGVKDTLAHLNRMRAGLPKAAAALLGAPIGGPPQGTA